jgi:5-methylcytosine-specific restriction endonuclease McrA
VDRELRWPDPDSGSLDHVIPLIAGGEHSRENTQLAHWLCNVRKGARTEQDR